MRGREGRVKEMVGIETEKEKGMKGRRSMRMEERIRNE
jgi:hypothetical protein